MKFVLILVWLGVSLTRRGFPGPESSGCQWWASARPVRALQVRRACNVPQSDNRLGFGVIEAAGPERHWVAPGHDGLVLTIPACRARARGHPGWKGPFRTKLSATSPGAWRQCHSGSLSVLSSGTGRPGRLDAGPPPPAAGILDRKPPGEGSSWATRPGPQA